MRTAVRCRDYGYNVLINTVEGPYYGIHHQPTFAHCWTVDIGFSCNVYWSNWLKGDKLLSLVIIQLLTNFNWHLPLTVIHVAEAIKCMDAESNIKKKLKGLCTFVFFPPIYGFFCVSKRCRYPGLHSTTETQNFKAGFT